MLLQRKERYKNMKTREHIENIIKEKDSLNYEYIMSETIVIDMINRAVRYSENGKTDLYNVVMDQLLDYVERFGNMRLTPANVKIGDGATVNLYTDRHAGTIVKITKCSITIRRDKATLSPDFKPEWIPGGFSAHCTNNNDQTYTYEADENGELTTLRWSKKYNRYGTPGHLTASKGRHEFYDYNF